MASALVDGVAQGGVCPGAGVKIRKAGCSAACELGSAAFVISTGTENDCSPGERPGRADAGCQSGSANCISMSWLLIAGSLLSQKPTAARRQENGHVALSSVRTGENKSCKTGASGDQVELGDIRHAPNV